MGVQANHIVKTFGNFIALDDVSMSVGDGKLTALLGPSGGGKSTLLRIIGGLDQADSGSIEIDGTDATKVPAQRRNVGFVFQHYAAFTHMSVRKNIAFGLEVRKRPKAEVKARVDELLALVHLEKFGDRLPAQLSGGQRQRMALARALAVQPRLLLLDEPFGALDAGVRRELREWLRRLHDEVHVTTVFVTHDQDEAMEVSDEIVVINGGAIEQVGAPDELYDRPTNEFVMRFLGPVTRLREQLVRPHDLLVTSEAVEGSLSGTVVRSQRVGHEIRAELQVGGTDTVQVQIGRGQASHLDLSPGSDVWVRASQDASTLQSAPGTTATPAAAGAAA